MRPPVERGQHCGTKILGVLQGESHVLRTAKSAIATPFHSRTLMPGSSQSLDLTSNSSESSYDSDDEYRLAQQEWEESLVQLQQLVSMVLLPFLGKWLGRRWSYWGKCSQK